MRVAAPAGRDYLADVAPVLLIGPSMRRPLLAGLGVGLLALSTVHGALAQSSGEREDDAKRSAQDAADKKKKQKEKDWNLTAAPLPDVKNAGPCPYVKVLYDASRYVELKDDHEAASAVGFTGEIQNLNSDCRYRNGKVIEPISVKMNLNFAFGRGPQAQGDTHDYRYWVAVTGPQNLVLAKTYFDMPVRFLPGQDRMRTNQLIDTISIPRANKTISGANFEVLVGFDVTPKMADFNRDGKRVRVNSGVDTAAASN